MSETPAAERCVDVFLHFLKEEGARVVFGVPGGLLHPFFKAVEDDPDMTLIVTKHEEGAAFMADGYARVSRKLAVCAGTSGPGATNLLTGVSVAFSDGVPVVVVTGQPPLGVLGHGAAQETSREDIDIVAMFRPVTKYSTMVTSPQSLAHHLRRGLRLALSGRNAPVHLNVPVDIWNQPLEEHWFDPHTYRPESQSFDRRAVQEAAAVLQDAEYPVILVGSGVASAGAEQHVRTLAEMLPARVVTTPRGKGLFPEDHSLSMGVLGFAGHATARELVLGAGVDVLLTVGASLNETTTYNWHPGFRPRRALIQLDVDADRIGRNYPMNIALVGDAQTVLVELIYHTHRRIREGFHPRSKWDASAPAVAPGELFLDPALRASEHSPVTPQRWRCDLQEVLPDDAIIFSDVGGHMLFNLHHLRIGEGQRFILNLNFGSMGHGTAAPVGAALAVRNRPVVAIIGDACFTMNGMELLTAAEYEVPVIWIVENNNMHGITWFGSSMLDEGHGMTSVRFKTRLEVAAIARAMGLPAWVVDGPGQIQSAFSEALATGRPCVIEVRVDPTVPPPLGERAKSITGFIAR
jgi:acetolactate synthase-1/2/3 large subunit